MLQMKVKDVEVEEDNKCFVECEDEYGDAYKFPMVYKKARIIALLLTDAYIPQESVYEFVVKLFNEFGFYVESVIINDGYNNRAKINIRKLESNYNIKSFYIAIPDALIIHLMTNSALYVDRKAEMLLADDVDKFFWYRFLKELDLC